MKRLCRTFAAFGRSRILLGLLFLLIGVPHFLAVILAMNRSLWLDEAWVANSIWAGSLADMFFYPTFLQTSPPMFLLLARWCAHAFGLANASFRIVPAAMQIIFAAVMILLARKTLSAAFAALAWVLCVINVVMLQYSIQLKQYSTEAAASGVVLLLAVAYLERPTRARFLWLCGAAMAAELFAYGMAFLIPGIVLAVLAHDPAARRTSATPVNGGTRRQRAILLTASTAIVFLIEYVTLVIPNSSPALLKSWFDGRMAIMGRPASIVDAFTRFTVFLSLPDPMRIRGKIALGAAALVLLWGLSIAEQRWRLGNRRLPLVQMMLLLPCLLVLCASLARRFPLSPRVCLFLLPCVVLLFVSALEAIARTWPRVYAPFTCAVVIAAVITGAMSAGALPFWSVGLPEEDTQSATAFMKDRMKSGDLALIHASTSEAFRFYATMFHWNPPGVKWGHTGWPCCRRGSQESFDAPSQVALYRDLQSNIPADFTGRLWYMHTTRPFHWTMVEMNEPRETNTYLVSRGCTLTRVRAFIGVAVEQYRCP